MAYKHFLLGALSDKPMSGYSLYKYFFEPWGRPLSQIYRTLNKMVQEGLIEGERIDQEKLPSQNLYSINEAGKAELVRWLKQRTRVKRTTQDEVIAKLWFGNKTGKENIVKHLKLFAKYAKDNLHFFENEAKPRIEARAKEQRADLEIICRLMVIELAIRDYKTIIAWTRNALNKINSTKPRGGNTGMKKAKK